MTVQRYLSKGYTIDSEGEQYVTLRKKKSVSLIEGFLVILEFPLLFLFGTGLILWILAILNYIMKSDEVITLDKTKTA